MHCRRSSLAACTVYGRAAHSRARPLPRAALLARPQHWLYAVGGMDARGALDTVEAYDALADRWLVAPFRLARGGRTGLGCAAVWWSATDETTAC